MRSARGSVRIDICVLTYLRPRSLARALSGIDRLRLEDPNVHLRIVIVDNDPEQSARPVCESLENRLQYPLLYVCEKRRGIPHARNAGIAVALEGADFIAFIDDDETPEPDWISRLLEALRTYGADAVSGPVSPRFEVSPPSWALTTPIFAPRSLASGDVLATAYTNNVVVSTRALAQMDRWFDERLALTGTSDNEFFSRFVAAGYRLVWSAEALNHEWIPSSRLRVGWALRRAFRTGASRSYIERLDPATAPARSTTACEAIVTGAKGVLLALAGVIRGTDAIVWGLYLASAGIGRLFGLAGGRYHEYRTIHGS